MEASSPLAAMQPPSFMPAWGHNDLFKSRARSHLSTTSSFGPGAFNFKDLSMKSGSDYYAMKPVRGSSPTASLAADLSQNFHIDQSPQLPTPRRSLFTSNLFAMVDGRENTTTPPPPSSSPGPLLDQMDISPLPHKVPYFTQIGMQSPTPQPTPKDDGMQSSPPRPAFLEAPRPISGLERKKSVLLRPNLSRSKGYSVTSMPSRPNPEAQLPLFRFGAGSSKLSTSTSMSLGECFMESPPHERRPQTANSPSTSMPLPRPKFGSMGGNVARNGSPISNHSRRPSNPLFRPRKQFRRSLSMIEHPVEAMRSKGDESSLTQSSLQSVMDVDETHQPVLPHFFQEGRPDSIPRIARGTLVDVLDGKYNDCYDQRVVIDCRFEYEYEGGHIDGAVNYNDKEVLANHLFAGSQPEKTLLIFHCEYSAHRAPIMARHIRKQDRDSNIEHYPRLTYPEVYILDGGYSEFFAEHRDRCFPQSYVEMDAKEHASACEREMGRLRQNRSKMGRSKTFAFGQHQMEDSPTALSRRSKDDVTMMGSVSPMLDKDRHHTRRTASY